jgi:hypothetical protein
MSPGEKAQLTAMIAAGWPGAKLSAASVALYEEFLADLRFDDARTAIGRLLCTSRFPPSIAEVREAVAEIAIGVRRSGLSAWGDVVMAIRRIGSYGEPSFDDPVVARVVRVLGWRTLCLADTPEGVDRANFAKLYDEYAQRERADTVSTPGRLLPAAHVPAQLPAAVRELTAGICSRRGETEPVQPNYGKTGTEKVRRL